MNWPNHIVTIRIVGWSWWTVFVPIIFVRTLIGVAGWRRRSRCIRMTWRWLIFWWRTIFIDGRIGVRWCVIWIGRWSVAWIMTRWPCIVVRLEIVNGTISCWTIWWWRWQIRFAAGEMWRSFLMIRRWTISIIISGFNGWFWQIRFTYTTTTSDSTTDLTAVFAKRRTTCVSIAFIVIVIRMIEKRFIASIGTGINIHFFQWNIDQFAYALTLARWIQAIVETFTHKTFFVWTLGLTIFHTFAHQRLSYPLRCYTLAGQCTSETGCNIQTKTNKISMKR